MNDSIPLYVYYPIIPSCKETPNSPSRSYSRVLELFFVYCHRGSPPVVLVFILSCVASFAWRANLFTPFCLVSFHQIIFHDKNEGRRERKTRSRGKPTKQSAEKITTGQRTLATERCWITQFVISFLLFSYLSRILCVEPPPPVFLFFTLSCAASYAWRVHLFASSCVGVIPPDNKPSQNRRQKIH